MKVIVVIVAAIMLASAHAADVKCAKLCSGGAASCMTGNEATACQATYQLSAMNSCFQCGTGAAAKTKDASNTAIGGAAGGGKWWKGWNSGTCNTCVANCETCASESTCATNGCKSAYRLKDSKTCEACSVSHCLKCEGSKDTCTLCGAGYGLSGGKCIKCNSHCNSCNTAPPKCDTGGCKTNYDRSNGANNDGQCFACVTQKESVNSCTKAKTWVAIANHGLWKDSAKGTCTGCVTNCAVCASQDTCTTCKSGFTAKSADSKTCGACEVANCSDCSGDAKKCKTCASGNLSADGTKCTTCAAPSVWSATGSGTCTACTVANCAQCQTNGNTCQSCKDGYILDGNTCQKCISNCKTCTVAQSTKAGNAAANQKCSGTNVGNNACFSGYFPDQTPTKQNLACISCGSNCVTCANQYSCQTCATGYQKDTSGKCIACKGDTCSPGVTTASTYHNTRFQTSVGRTCKACISGCATANQNAWDGACACQTCVATMWPWNNANPAVALAAQNSVLPTGGSCKSCGSNCNLCGSKDKCSANSCASGYTNLGVLGVCQQCTVASCTTCPAAVGTCTKCAAGYSLKGDGKACYKCPTVTAGQGVFNDAAAGTCVTCPTGCSSCNSATVCTGCMAGYVQSADTKSCVKCAVSNCAACSLATKDTLCTTCAGAYTRKTDGKACYKCDAGAAVFSDPAKGACVSCGVDHCVSCTAANSCNACKSGYVLEGGKCYACGIKNCASCAYATRNTVCAACEGKYAKQNIANAAAGSATNKCDALCDAHATTCGDAYTATACDTKKNYYLAGGRCVYCNLKMVTGTAAAGKATTAGNQYLTTSGICSTCDKDADGCASSTAPAKCKTSTNEVVGGNCVAKCKTYEFFGTFTGKCHNGCVSNVGTGTVNGGALNGKAGGCYSDEGIEGQLCAKGHHVQGASVGLCCDDDNSASSIVVGSITFASVMTALYALM